MLRLTNLGAAALLILWPELWLAFPLGLGVGLCVVTRSER